MKKRNVPTIIIGLSIPFMWALVFCLAHFGVFDWMDNTDMSEGLKTVIIILIANIPVLVFIGYGIYNAITSEPTIPKVKERMPWDKSNSLDVDEEWRQQLADAQDEKQ